MDAPVLTHQQHAVAATELPMPHVIPDDGSAKRPRLSGRSVQTCNEKLGALLDCAAQDHQAEAVFAGLDPSDRRDALGPRASPQLRPLTQAPGRRERMREWTKQC